MTAKPEMCNLERFSGFEVTAAGCWGPSSWHDSSGGVSERDRDREVAAPRRFPAFRRALGLLGAKHFSNAHDVDCSTMLVVETADVAPWGDALGAGAPLPPVRLRTGRSRPSRAAGGVQRRVRPSRPLQPPIRLQARAAPPTFPAGRLGGDALGADPTCLRVFHPGPASLGHRLGAWPSTAVLTSISPRIDREASLESRARR